MRLTRFACTRTRIAVAVRVGSATSKPRASSPPSTRPPTLKALANVSEYRATWLPAILQKSGAMWSRDTCRPLQYEGFFGSGLMPEAWPFQECRLDHLAWRGDPPSGTPWFSLEGAVGGPTCNLWLRNGSIESVGYSPSESRQTRSWAGDRPHGAKGRLV